MSDPRWPLGEPINRPAPKSPWHPIPGRPRWERHSETGQERYVEPPRPPPWMPPVMPWDGMPRPDCFCGTGQPRPE